MSLARFKKFDPIGLASLDLSGWRVWKLAVQGGLVAVHPSQPIVTARDAEDDCVAMTFEDEVKVRQFGQWPAVAGNFVELQRKPIARGIPSADAYPFFVLAA